MNLALFDFDSTITTRDTFADFIRFAAPRSRQWWAVALAPLLAGYRMGWVSGHVLRASAVRAGLRGLSLKHVQTLGEHFAADVLSQIERPEAMARIEWHRARGDHIVVVSGALDLLLAPWCRRHGLQYLCSSLETKQGMLTGAYQGEQCVAEEKARRVRAAFALAEYTDISAYGDSSDDFALLRLAHHRYFRWQPWQDKVAS